MLIIMIVILIISALIFTIDYQSGDIVDHVQDVAGDTIEKGEEKVVEKIVETGKEKIDKTLKNASEKILYEEYDVPGYFGSYNPEKLNQYEKNVLFFAAEWCPSFHALEKIIKEKEAFIPPNISIMKVDFEDQELKEKYKVVKQQTFIFVDENGKEIKRWKNSKTLEDVIFNLQ